MKRLLMKSWKRDFPMLHSHEIFVCFTLLPYMIYKVLGMLGTVARSAEAQNTRGVHEEARADGNHWRRSGRSKSKAWATPERFGLSKYRCCYNEKTLSVSPIPLI